MARWCKAWWLMDCHCGGFSVEVMAPFVDKGWGWLNDARQYDDCWCDWVVAELGGSEIELWNCGFNVVESLNNDFIFFCTSNPFFERRLLIFFSIISICFSVFLIKPSIIVMTL
jgi:hypothetical protein